MISILLIWLPLPSDCHIYMSATYALLYAHLMYIELTVDLWSWTRLPHSLNILYCSMIDCSTTSWQKQNWVLYGKDFLFGWRLNLTGQVFFVFCPEDCLSSSSSCVMECANLKVIGRLSMYIWFKCCKKLFMIFWNEREIWWVGVVAIVIVRGNVRESSSKSRVCGPNIWWQVEMEEQYIISSSSLIISSNTHRCL